MSLEAAITKRINSKSIPVKISGIEMRRRLTLPTILYSRHWGYFWLARKAVSYIHQSFSLPPRQFVVEGPAFFFWERV